jgi:aminoglycoside/choline kinase family phosphotransferase
MPDTPDTPTDDRPEQGDLAPILDALARRGHPVAEVRTMVGDVSRRRYYRLRLADRARAGGGPAVLAVYPDEMLDACRRYLRAGRLLAGQGVRVAEVLDSDRGGGWVLLEDFGEHTLYEHAARPWHELGHYFEAAVDAIGRIAALPPGEVAELNPPLDGALLRRELEQTRDCFFEPLGLDGRLDERLHEPEAGELRAALDTVCRRLGEEAPVPCHRDFGARNLMPLAPGEGAWEVGVLDHQDLRLGPPAYDLASLLNDSLFPPPELEERLLERAGCQDGGPERESYHRAAAQRTLKAVGSYAAFARRGEGRHLGLIPPTLARALRHLERLPEAASLAAPLAAAWRPALDGEDLERLVLD